MDYQKYINFYNNSNTKEEKKYITKKFTNEIINCIYF
jgi:hypothetical protein